METEDLFRVEFSEDGNLGVEFSEDFLSSSQEEQIQALEAFFWKKTLGTLAHTRSKQGND